MKVHVQFFSRLRDLTETQEMELDVADGTKVSDLLEKLYSHWPALRGWDKSLLIAAAAEFVGRDYSLKQGDRISIMPPVQGG